MSERYHMPVPTISELVPELVAEVRAEAAERGLDVDGIDLDNVPCAGCFGSGCPGCRTTPPSASSPGSTTSTPTATEVIEASSRLLAHPKLNAMHPKQAARELMLLGVHYAVVERYLEIRWRAFFRPDVGAMRRLQKSYAKATKYRRG